MATPSNPFANMAGIMSEQIQATERLKMAIIGGPGVGKSWMAATAPKPIRYYDHDDRSESLEGKTGISILSRPTMLQIETDLSVMKANKLKKLALPATIVHDSVTFLNRAMEEEIFRQEPKLARTIRVGNSTSMKLRNGWDVINGVQRYIEYLIGEYATLGVSMIFVFHEKDEKDRTTSSAAESKYTGFVTVDPQYLQNCLSLFNEVYRMHVDTIAGKTSYKVTCRPTNEFVGKTTMLIDSEELPDIATLITKHKAARAAQKVQPLTTK